MGFEFCWEHHRCTRDCRVKDLGALFCWQIARQTGFRDREECEECSYYRRWAGRELSTRDFAARFERRKSPRSVRRVLVVDDEPNILYALQEVVRDKGFECLSAVNGEEGLIIARGVRPDLVISDVIMPRMDGLELCERLKADPETSGIPVVLVTVKAAEKDHLLADRAGADAYLVKPFQMRELEETIRRLVQPKG